MQGPIRFDDQSAREADEIGDVGADRDLAAELKVIEAAVFAADSRGRAR